MSNYSSHSFSVELATKIGLREAIILQHLYWWHEHNQAVPEMNIDGRTWFFLSASQIQETFPYLSEKVVRNILDGMVEKGYIVKDHKGEGQQKFNRTNWYALTPTSLGFFHFPKWANGDTEKGKSIVNSNSYIKISSNEDIIYNKAKRFVKPSLDEVRAYCRERGNSVDAETFYDFYESKGWKVGNQPMKDCQAAVRTWEKSRTTHASKNDTPAPKRKNTMEDLLALGAEMFGTQINYHDEQ